MKCLWDWSYWTNDKLIAYTLCITVFHRYTLHQLRMIYLCWCWYKCWYFVPPPCWYVHAGVHLILFACNLSKFKCPEYHSCITAVSSGDFTSVAILCWCKWTCDGLPFIQGHRCWQNCDSRKVLGRGYLLLKPAPIPPHKCLFFFFFLPVTHPLLPVYWKPSVALYWMFSFWFGMWWARFLLSGFSYLY